MESIDVLRIQVSVEKWSLSEAAASKQRLVEPVVYFSHDLPSSYIAATPDRNVNRAISRPAPVRMNQLASYGLSISRGLDGLRLSCLFCLLLLHRQPRSGIDSTPALRDPSRTIHEID